MDKKLTYLFSILLLFYSCSQKHLQIKTLNNRVTQNNSKIVFNDKKDISILEVNQKITDSIMNWQLYADNKLLFKSNEVEKEIEKIKHIAEFNVRNNYENLNFFIFYDFYSDEIERKIELRFGDKVIGVFQEKGKSSLPVKLPLTYINTMTRGYLNKEINMKYFDKFNSNGLIVGAIKITTD